MSELMVAEFGVRQLHARYADAVFRKDWDAFADCWTEDAEWRIRGNIYRGRGEIVGMLQRAMENFHKVIMTFRTPILQLQADGSLRARTWVTEQNGFKSGRPGSTIGTYFERLTQQDGVWRRAYALFQLHYIGPADLTGEYFDQPDYGPPPAFPPPDAVPPDVSKIVA
jgi:ketosteroid isomerase-like protein